HRQEELLRHYTKERGIHTIIWDKDQRFRRSGWPSGAPNVTVCEPALFPRRDANRLLFPIADKALDSTDPTALTKQPRDLPLVYIGNQYDRDDSFDIFFAPAAATHEHRVAGK